MNAKCKEQDFLNIAIDSILLISFPLVRHIFFPMQNKNINFNEIIFKFSLAFGVNVFCAL